ncbi:MAG TPA: AraC family transcriptional regulator [Thermoanaerobaculia bacterium]|nr:AraC family transcriptional regulator [Thermoanaerobaculia bacterium]
MTRVHPALAPYVKEILVEDPAGAPPAPRPYEVLPKPFPVIGFQYRGRLEVLRDDGPELLARGGITGLQATRRSFRPGPETRSVLVVLEPHGAWPLLGCPMSEVAGGHVPLGSILPAAPTRDLEDRLQEAGGIDELGELVQSFFLDLLDRSRRRPHPAVLDAVGRIRQAHGTLPVEAVARGLGISRRQMERLFKLQVGVGPKELASLTRFEWVLGQLPRRRSWADLAFGAGYADQSHFVRSFTARTGRPPGDFAAALEGV